MCSIHGEHSRPPATNPLTPTDASQIWPNLPSNERASQHADFDILPRNISRQVRRCRKGCWSRTNTSARCSRCASRNERASRMPCTTTSPDLRGNRCSRLFSATGQTRQRRPGGARMQKAMVRNSCACRNVLRGFCSKEKYRRRAEFTTPLMVNLQRLSRARRCMQI